MCTAFFWVAVVNTSSVFHTESNEVVFEFLLMLFDIFLHDLQNIFGISCKF